MSFDFQVERRLSFVPDAYVDYEGNICIEYPEYYSCGTTSTGEIEFTITQLESLLIIAKAQKFEYDEHQRSL